MQTNIEFDIIRSSSLNADTWPLSHDGSSLIARVKIILDYDSFERLKMDTYKTFIRHGNLNLIAMIKIRVGWCHISSLLVSLVTLIFFVLRSAFHESIVARSTVERIFKWQCIYKFSLK